MPLCNVSSSAVENTHHISTALDVTELKSSTKNITQNPTTKLKIVLYAKQTLPPNKNNANLVFLFSARQTRYCIL